MTKKEFLETDEPRRVVFNALCVRKLKATMKKNRKCDGCIWLVIPDWIKNPSKALSLAHCSHTQDASWDWRQANLFCKAYESQGKK